MSRRVWVLTAVVLGSSIVFLDSTVVTVALPAIGRELPSELLGVLEAQSYVYYGYLLSLSALIVLAGALADDRGRRKIFAIGMAGFGAASIVCGLAPTMEVLIACRVLQGAAGALLVPGSLAIITASFEGSEQGRAFGIWAGASGATTILGPAVGGALVAYASWRMVFLINVPLVALGLWATLRYVEESRDPSSSGRFDWTGAALVIFSVGGLTFGAIRGQAQAWAAPSAVIAVAVGALALLALPLWLRRSRHPLVPPHLFASRNFSVTNISTLLIYGALYVAFQYLALFAIGVLGYNELGYGIATIPSSLFLAFFSARVGRLAARYGPRVFMTVGPALIGAGFLWFARIPLDSSPWAVELDDLSTFVPPRDYVADVLVGLVLVGLGLAIMVAPLTTALMRSVPVAHAGVASAVNNAISRVGPQLAGALLFVAVSAAFYLQLAEITDRRTTPSVREQVAPLNPSAPGTPDALQRAARRASVEAFHLGVGVAALLCFAGAAVNGIGIRNDQLRDETAQEPAAEAAAAI